MERCVQYSARVWRRRLGEVRCMGWDEAGEVRCMGWDEAGRGEVYGAG